MSDIPKVTFATLSVGQPLLDHMRSVMAVMNTDALGDGYEVVAAVSVAPARTSTWGGTR